jgi:hypothetical protein
MILPRPRCLQRSIQSLRLPRINTILLIQATHELLRRVAYQARPLNTLHTTDLGLWNPHAAFHPLVAHAIRSSSVRA